MQGMFDSHFELYKLKVKRFLDFPDSQNLNKLVEDIKAAAFLQKITDREAEYLLNELPLDKNEEIDDGYKPSEVSRKTGGIHIQNIGKTQGIRKYIKDELDDFEEEEEQEESGFANLSSYTKRKSTYDELDDFDENEDEDKESGFSSFENYKTKKDQYLDELVDFDEDENEDEETESGFLNLF